MALFFDLDHNVIKVGGRLSQSFYSEIKKLHIVLSKSLTIVNLIIRKFYEVLVHGGGQLSPESHHTRTLDYSSKTSSEQLDQTLSDLLQIQHF